MILLMSVLAVAAPSAVSHASHSWANYHWARTNNPFLLDLGDNVSSTWDAYLGEASTDWSVSAVLDTLIVPGGTRPKQCRMTTGMIEVCSAKYGRRGWLGLATISVSGDHITAGSAQVNDTYFDTATYDTPAWRRLVMCQEVAHAFGLAHQDEIFNNQNLGSCMDYTSNPEGPPSNEHPNQHDYDQLVTIYDSHLDSTATISTATAAAVSSALRALDLAAPGQWGQLVSLSRDGGQAIYEFDFGGGNKRITFVTWTVAVANELRGLLEK